MSSDSAYRTLASRLGGGCIFVVRTQLSSEVSLWWHMKQKTFYQIDFRNPRNLFLLNAQLTDFARVGIELFAQRVVIYLVAFLLEAFYYSWMLAALSLSVLIISEIYDYVTFRRILGMKQRDIEETRFCLRLLLFGAALSAVNIAAFAISIAILQGHTTHFMSLFFLLAAALFVTMNNHQIKSVLYVKLGIYFAAFLFIPIYDIAATGAPITSELWVQFFTSLFVLSFIVDCSRVSTALYQKTLKQMEDIRHEHDRTLAAYAAKSEFLATVSHELRTPLTSIKGSLDLVECGAFGKIPEKMERVLTIAQRNAKRLRALIDDLLDLQKMDAGRMSFTFDNIEVTDFLKQAVAQNQPFASELCVDIVLDPPEKDLYIFADRSRLEQVISNILSNAAKFSDAGSVVVVRSQKRGASIRIAIVDQGVGLNEADRKTVFEEFSQLDSSDRRQIGGTGLGMNISERIIAAHSGVIDYYKNSGAGTTFYVDLPIANEDIDRSKIDVDPDRRQPV